MRGSYDDGDIPSFTEGCEIPKVIYQTFATRTLPAELEAAVLAMRRLNPEYAYRRFDDGQARTFVAENYPAPVLAGFDSIDPAYGAARADLFRYLLLYKCGGVYLDIKSTTAQPLRKHLSTGDRFILSHWRYEDWGTNEECAHVPGGEYQQWFIISAAGHPFLRAVIKEVLARIASYRPWCAGVGRLGTLRTTGPRAYTNAIYPIVDQHIHREVSEESELGLRYSIYADHIQHRKLSRTYYRNNRTPLIKPSVAVWAGWIAWRAGRRLLRTVKGER